MSVPRTSEEWLQIAFTALLSSLGTMVLLWMTLGASVITEQELSNTLRRYDTQLQRIQVNIEVLQQGVARIEGKLEAMALRGDVGSSTHEDSKSAVQSAD